MRALAIIYLILAGIAVVAGLIGAGWVLVRLPLTVSDKVIAAAAVLVSAFFAVITMLAIAEVMKLAIDIEHNTRISAMRALRPGSPIDTPPTEPARDGGRFRHIDEETAEAALLRGH